METLDEAVALRPADFRGSMFDPFQLEEEFVGMVVWPAAELASIVAQNRIGINGDSNHLLHSTLARCYRLPHGTAGANRTPRGGASRHAAGQLPAGRVLHG